MGQLKLQGEETSQSSIVEALKSMLRGSEESLEAHLQLFERDLVVDGTKTKLHCYFLPVDITGNVRYKRLAEFLRDRIIDYAIPRHLIQEAIQEASKTGSSAASVKLFSKARSLFTDLSNTGEGGELLLFIIAEFIFKLPQIICKMSLKTSTRVHYHGADGVYADMRDDGGLNLYWAESKMYADPGSAITQCLKSLAPFLLQEEGEDADREQDIYLINDNVNFEDPKIVVALKSFLDPDDPASLSVKNCGFSLVAYDCKSYTSSDQKLTVEAIKTSIQEQLAQRKKHLKKRIDLEKLSELDIHFICVSFKDVEDFRAYLLKLLGFNDEA